MTWETGLPLETASRRYGPPKIAQRYAHLEKSHPALDSWAILFGKTIEAFNNTQGETSPFGSAEMRKLAQVASEKSNLLQTLQEALVHRLKAGKLLGFGYEMPRQASSEPVKIPSDVWFGSVKWGTSSVKGNGLEFIQVRVCEAQHVALEAPYVLPSVKRGRPSRSDQISEAFWSLDESGEVPDTVENLKALFTPILRRIDILYPDQAGDRAGLSEKTLYEKVSNLIKAKSARSQ